MTVFPKRLCQNPFRLLHYGTYYCIVVPFDRENRLREGGSQNAGRCMQAGGRGRQKAPPEFKEKVMQVLIDIGFEEARSAKLAQEDFLHLLASFNNAGIRFA